MDFGRTCLIICAICALFANENIFTYGMVHSLVNVAFGKPASQSSTYIRDDTYGDKDQFPYSASLAVDGNSSTSFRFDSCSHTNAENDSAWWEVDLEGSYRIAKVVIFQRSDGFTERNTGYTISGKQENNDYKELKKLNTSESSVITVDISHSQQFKAIRITNKRQKGNTNDVYICLCEVQVFADVDECMDRNVCSGRGRCTNNVGSFTCECSAGYTGKSCNTDVDECMDRNVCSGRGRCTNNVGSFTCECSAGYTGKSCNTDMDECMDSNVCSGRGRCINNVGSFTCECTAGYTGKSCNRDMDECMDLNVCSGRGRCINNVGSFTCECSAGYTGKSCDTVRQCVDISAPRNSSISYEIGIEEMTKTYNSTVSMICDQGYSSVGNTFLRCSKSGEWDITLGHCVAIQCTDLVAPNHSKLSYEHGIERKRNTFNSTVLMACVLGYRTVGETFLRCGESGTWGGSLGRCTVIRCDNEPIQLPVHSKLNYSGGIEGPGTYNTEAIIICDQGYHLTMATRVRCNEYGKWEGTPGKCSVIQCSKQLPQPDHGEITYTGGIEGGRTYNTMATVRCKEGYNLTKTTQIRCNEQGEWEGSNGTCSDIDECRDGDSVCSNNAYCINTEGTFTCRCKEGFTGKNCEIDVDECKNGNSVCNTNGYCINTQGSFVCICKERFTGRNCETEIWSRSLFASVVAAASAAVIVIITLLIIWRRGGFQFCCNGLGREPKEVEITCPQPDLRMDPTSNNTIENDDAYEEINEHHNNMIEMSEYLEPTVAGIERGNREYYNCRNAYEKLQPHRNYGNEMYV